MQKTKSQAALPKRLLPMLATSSKPVDDPAYLFEIKWDGVRAMVSVESKKLRIWGGEGVDYTERYPELAVLRQLPSGTMLDGELVAIRDGRADSTP
jgi:bifunctional non-homologous end joining protein LigD